MIRQRYASDATQNAELRQHAERLLRGNEDKLDMAPNYFPKRLFDDWYAEIIQRDVSLSYTPIVPRITFSQPAPRTVTTACVDWQPTSIGANVPTARNGSTAVWTGSEMIIWGGYNSADLNSGGRYTPATDSWLPISLGTNVPAARAPK